MRTLDVPDARERLVPLWVRSVPRGKGARRRDRTSSRAAQEGVAALDVRPRRPEPSPASAGSTSSAPSATRRAASTTSFAAAPAARATRARRQFFLSMDDDLMRIFGGDRVKRLMAEGQEMSMGFLTRALERAQKRVEERNFDIRKNLLEYDGVMDEQRKLIYDQRQRVLAGTGLERAGAQHARKPRRRRLRALPLAGRQGRRRAGPRRPRRVGAPALRRRDRARGNPLRRPRRGRGHPRRARQRRLRRAREGDDARGDARSWRSSSSSRSWTPSGRTTSTRWTSSRAGIGLRSYAQIDPLVAYKKEGYELFQEMMAAVDEDVSTLMFRLRIDRSAEEELSQSARWRVADTVHQQFGAHGPPARGRRGRKPLRAKARPRPSSATSPSSAATTPAGAAAARSTKSATAWTKNRPISAAETSKHVERGLSRVCLSTPCGE